MMQPSGPLPPMAEVRAAAATLGDVLLDTVRRSPDLEAVVFPAARMTFAGLAERAGTFARGLMALGVGPRDRVGLLMPNGPDGIALLFGTALAGAVAVPINTRYRAVELPFVIADAGLRAIVTTDGVDDHVDLTALLLAGLPGLGNAGDPRALALPGAPELRSVVRLARSARAGFVSEEQLLALAATVSPADAERRGLAVRVRDDALLLYTSGTTASPRGCRLTHEAIVRNWTLVAAVLGLSPGDRCWAPCPLFHLAAIGPLVACAQAGAAFVSDVWFDPARALELVQAERATHLYPAYPPITQALFGHEGFPEADLRAARVIVNVGPADLLRQMQRAVPDVTQLSLYGSTEGGGAITYTRREDPLEARLTTCGAPLAGTDVRIADPDTGALRDVGVEGEIEVRGPALFEGYANDPDKTSAAFARGDGWYRTGDRGALDADGRLRYLGRIKDMLKVGGENVAPAEIESVLSTHPAVKLVQVVGVPDERLEEVPAAFVELRSGFPADADALIVHCAERIARFKVPRHVRFVEDWPMSATKIQKGPLRDALLAELEGRLTER